VNVRSPSLNSTRSIGSLGRDPSARNAENDKGPGSAGPLRTFGCAAQVVYASFLEV
jgi:hypothetical protein